MTTTPRTVTDNDINDFLAKLSAKTDRYFAKNYAILTPPVFHAEPGRKYIRVVETSHGGGQSVVCFIGKADGLLWKAAAWKQRATNFSRGSIFGPNGWTDGDHIYFNG